jgi:hypothetical protein
MVPAPAIGGFSQILTDANDTHGWRDEARKHPMAVDTKNTIATRKAGEVLRVIRNAPAHGNIVYSTVFVFALRCT